MKKLFLGITLIGSLTTHFVSATESDPIYLEEQSGRALGFELKKVADLPGFPRVISDSGYVVGFVSSTADTNWPDVPEFSTEMMYRWKSESGVEWLTIPGMYSSREKDVNNNGDAVAWVCEEECYTVLWHKSGEIESLKSEIDEPLNDFIKDLGFNAFNDRIHINDSGQLAGTVVYKPYDQYEGSRATIAWTWDKKSKLKILVEPNIRPRGQAYGISNSGVVYGSYHHDDHVNEAATYWDKHGEMQQFKFPQFPYGTVATGMNNSGVLVGVESLMYSSPWKIDTKSGKRLHIEDTGGVARPTKVLDNGYIAGSTQSDLNSQLSPILWDSKGNVYYLNDYLDDESYSLGGWIGINNSLLMGSALVNKNTDWYEDGALYQITVVSPE